MTSRNCVRGALTALLAGALVTPLAAQQTTHEEFSIAVAEAPSYDHREGKPKNGGFAVSAVTIVDGAYATNQIGTLPRHGGPYNFLTNLPNGAFDPTFTPDGATIFFWGPVENGPDGIYTVPVEGGAVVQLQTDCMTNPNCLGEGNPAVSPNGRELLEGRALGPADQNGCLAFVGIFRLHIDGSHAKQVTKTGAPCTSDFEPRWSPDGHGILYQHQDLTGLFSLWVMHKSGPHAEQITPPGMDIGNPDWSPDGTRIVFQSPAEPADDQTPQQIYTIHPDGTNLVQITHYEPIGGVVIGTFGPRWSPDGRLLVFAHRDDKTTVGPDGRACSPARRIRLVWGRRGVSVCPPPLSTPASIVRWGREFNAQSKRKFRANELRDRIQYRELAGGVRAL